MTLYMIGLGLHDEKDISIKGIEAVKKCERVYLEDYTSRLSVSIDQLEKFYNKKIIAASRIMVEKEAENTILKDASVMDTAFLVIGDPFGATTHMDLRLRAREAGIEVKYINNASILNAVGIIGLELYKFGKTTSIPFDNENIKTPIEVFRKNDKNRMHSLILLDLDPRNNRYMTVNMAVDYFIKSGLDINRRCIGCAGIGSDYPEIAFLKASHLIEHSFTRFPQCLIIPSELHFVEEEALGIWAVK